MTSKQTIPIFDSLSHPYLANINKLPSFTDLDQSLASSSQLRYPVKYSCTIGLEGQGAYDKELFIKETNKYPHLVPVAAYEHAICQNYNESQLEKYFTELKELGYKAVKVHPIISKIDLKSQQFEKIFSAATAISLPVFLCTYCYKSPYSLLSILKELLPQYQELKLALIHGGATELLSFSELVRNYSNLLLDLSFTFIKYQGSSLDNDIRYLFQNFDRRICVGSDFPDFNHSQLSARFASFAEEVADDKLENIAYKNLAKFLGVKNEFFTT